MAYPEDNRYETVNLLIANNKIPAFRDIFDHIPITVVAKDMSTNFLRMRGMVDDPTRLSVAEIIRLADFFEVDMKVLTELIFKQLEKEGKLKGK